MGLLKHLRSRSRLGQDHSQSIDPPPQALPFRSQNGPCSAQSLTKQVLESIFALVCPHTQDMTYESCERSQVGDGCMLCDLRDLASCAQTCRQWSAVAQPLLYRSVRIDAVHYCALEHELAARRKKAHKHFRSKSNVEPLDVPIVRLQLLCRTVREQPPLGSQVLIFKLPYMARETAKADLAMAVSAMPNLRYVDLPDGFFTGDSTCLALRMELQAACADIRKMIYRAGSERDLLQLPQQHWRYIEVLELDGVMIDPVALRTALVSLSMLQQLALIELPWLDDTVFESLPGQLPDFPPLRSLALNSVPRVTAAGLKAYLAPIHVHDNLRSLELQCTGVTVQDLGPVLSMATGLCKLSISATVSQSLSISASARQPLESASLKTLHYEITASEQVHGHQRPAETFYAYLASSILQRALPALDTLYVLSPGFADLLLMTTPHPFANDSKLSLQNNSPSSLAVPSSAPKLGLQPTPGTLSQTIEIFAKDIDELEWTVETVMPPAKQGRTASASGSRPLSTIFAARGLGPQWAQGGEARKSVMVGNGLGGYLAIPQEEAPRPLTAEREGMVAPSGTLQSASVGAFLRSPHGRSASGGDDRRKNDLWR